MSYVPRRASLKRWLDQAPSYILDCFDNGGKTVDRYTVILCGPFHNGKKTRQDIEIAYLGLSGGEGNVFGFSQFGHFDSTQCSAFRYRSQRERVRWLDLPENVRAHIVSRCAD